MIHSPRLLLLALLVALPCFAAERVALVIGNNAYQHADTLTNCVNDARAMSDKLKEAQFSVLLVEDATAEKMHESLEKFQEMSRECQVGLVFYAGHGLEEDGKNYLVPVDAALERKAQLPLQTLSLAQVLDAMKQARIPAKIVLLDSCRNMPLSRGWRSTRGIGGGGLAGLASSDLPESTLVYYSTAPGQVALDEGSGGKHSPFTQGLLTTMSKPGIHALEALNQVEDSVQEQTQGKQRPKLFSDGETKAFRNFSFAGSSMRPNVAGEMEIIPPTGQFAAAAAPPGQWLALAQAGDALAQALLARAYLESADGMLWSQKEALAWAEKSAARGHPLGLHLLGECLEDDYARPKDVRHREAQALYSEAVLAGFETKAAQGGAQWMERVGRACQKGRGMPKNSSNAVKWFLLAAKMNDPAAMVRLGAHYESAVGDRSAKGTVEAVKWYRRAAELRDPNGMVRLALCYLRGTGVVKDKKEAMDWFHKAMEMGDVSGMVALAGCYLSGSGIERDEQEAVKLLRRAAEAGHAEATIYFGVCQFQGLGIPKDEDGGMKWILRGTEVGGPIQLYYLGMIYEMGSPIRKDPAMAAQWYRKAAEAGIAEGMRALGQCYANGVGVPKDETDASKWYFKAANSGDTSSMMALSACYAKGTGVPKDETEAVRWHRKAAEAGDDSAMNSLGDLYADGNGVAKDMAEAAKWYRKAAEVEKVDGMVRFGVCQLHGLGVPRDEASGEKWILRATEIFCTNVLTELAHDYETGTSRVPKDLISASKWSRKAAEAGDMMEIYKLTGCFSKVAGAKQDMTEAVKWYHKAADLDITWAMNSLAGCYEDGTGVEKDEQEAAKWYRKAAELNDSSAMNRLGNCYYNGFGVAKDYREAVRWYCNAAALGEKDAMNIAGNCYYSGTGVAKNEKTAVEWYRKAAEAGVVNAMTSLENCYTNGLGVSKDKAQAAAWREKAEAAKKQGN